VSRIPFDAGVQMLLGAGLAPDRVLKILNRETGEDDDAFGLWQDGKRLSPAYVRTHLNFTYSANAGKIRIVPINPREITLKGPLIGVLLKATFELDAEQIEALIAKPTSPEPGLPPAVEKTVAALKKLFPPHGVPPKRMPEKTIAKALEDEDAKVAHSTLFEALKIVREIKR
jgi:hypothetical protein